jgi:hypothetical protein
MNKALLVSVLASHAAHAIKNCISPKEEPEMTTLSKEDVVRALEALESMDDFARMDIGVDPIGPYKVLREFIETRAYLVAENERLRDEDDARYIHSCGPKCMRADCVNRRLHTAPAAAEADNERLRLVIADIGQTLAWNSFGECRSYQSTSPLLTPKEADALAKCTLSKPRDDSALREMIAGVYEECAKVCDSHNDYYRNGEACGNKIRALAEKARHGS